MTDFTNNILSSCKKFWRKAMQKNQKQLHKMVECGTCLIMVFITHGSQVKLCQLNLKWDEDIPDDISNKCLKWKENLPNLEMVHLGRCFKPHGFGKVVDCSLHHFSDACENGYVQASYIRLVDDGGRIHCSLVMGKARVAPLISSFIGLETNLSNTYSVI